MSESAPIVILGGGLTGLSAAYHLRPLRALVLEREREAGGLARTRVEDGFTFDCTGHLLHLRDPEIKGLVDRILPGAFATHERRALIHSKGVLTAYPFQANLHGLPAAVVKECVQGFVEALVRRASDGEPDLARVSFREWIDATFGAGIAGHFMLPYNSKLWRTDLRDIECGWVSWSIPRPTLQEILDGAFGTTVRGLGYNPTFLYPKQGGISILPEALARACPDVRTGETVVAVDATARTVTLASGVRIAYGALISTLPLDRLLALTVGLPGDVPEAGRRLRAVRVLNISLGVDRSRISGAHWIYFPEPEFAFYRVGFPANLSDALVPQGCSSLYVERSLLWDEAFDEAEEVGRAVDDLRRAGILWRSDRVVYRSMSVLDPAYVVYDRYRADNLPRLLTALRGLGIHSVGRFGAWEYNSMEGAMRAGIEVAAALASSRTASAAGRRGGLA